MINKIQSLPGVCLAAGLLFACNASHNSQSGTTGVRLGNDSLPFNPIIRDKYTADPAALVHGEFEFLQN